MQTDRPKKDRIFNIAAEIQDSTQRAAYLDDACGDDASLREQVEELLQHDQDGASFLDSPPPGIDPTIDQPLTEKPGTVIGPYKLLQQIGEGGFGVVYMAEQHKPVRRKIALKIIKPGMDTKEVIARFEAERQALALMDHPNIAKVFDAGATETGRPYFVMELVRGIPLIEFCDENNLNTKERLSLFVAVCGAIQHAHQKGIIHRDLKPSNVMITLYNNKPVPKVIDFGVSKAISQQLTERTLFTAYGQMVGTPVYMSPEQAQMSGLDVDTRSDIYSLGVMLFELLTGSTPLDAEQLRKSGYAEMQRLIREEEAPRPSQRLSTQSGDALTKIAKNRGTDPSQLGRQVRGELDWIVIKALEKDRNRRYETANSFAADVERYLNNDAVTACPPSLVYRTRKFIHRNRGPVLGTGIVIAGMLLAVVGLAVGYFRAETSARNTRQAYHIASQEKERAQELMAREHQARLETVAAGRLKDESLTDVYTTMGLTSAERGLHAEAVAWFAAAAQLAPDESRAGYNRIRARSWANNMLVPMAALPHDAEWLAELQLHTGGRYLMTRPFGPKHGRDVVDLGTPVIWDFERSIPLELPSALSTLRAARWSRDGSWIAVITAEGEFFEVAFPSLNVVRPLATEITGELLNFSPSGRYLGVFGDRVARVWDCQQQDYATPLLPHPDFVTHLSFSPEEDRIVTACQDSLARVFSTHSGSKEPLFAPVHHVAGGKGATQTTLGTPAVLAGEQRLFTASSGKLLRTLICRDATSGDELKRWRNEVYRRQVVSDGSRLVTWNSLIDAHTLERQTLSPHLGGFIAFAPSNDLLASATHASLRFYTFPGLQEVVQTAAMERTVNQIEFSPDGLFLATAERGGVVKVWRHVKRNPGQYEVPGTRRSFADVSNDGRYFMPTGLSQRSAEIAATQVYEVETGRPASEPIRPGGLLIDGKFSPCGDLVAIATSRGTSTSRQNAPGQQAGDLSVWNWRQATRRFGFPLDVEPRSLDFSPDGRRVAVLSADGKVSVVDVENGETLLQWSAHKPYLQNNWYVNNGEIAYSPDGTSIVTWGAHDFVRVWHADSGRLRYELKHNGRVYDVTFSPEGELLATSEWGGDRVQVWAFDSGQRVGTPLQHPDWAFDIGFSPDSKLLVSGCRDRAARVWNWQTGEMVCPPLRHEHEVHAVSFVQDGRAILTGCDDRTARVWEHLTGNPLTPPIPISGYGLTISLTPDELHAVIGGNSGPSLAVLCLEEILRDDGEPIEDLVARSKFFSGHRVANGGLQRLSNRESLEIYANIRDEVLHVVNHPGYVAPEIAPLPSADPRKLLVGLDAMFSNLDRNSNGVLEKQEGTPTFIQRILSLSALNGTAREGDETVDRDEFRSRWIRSFFNKMDQNGDGKIQRDEVSAADFRSTFQDMDVNRDDAITFDEYTRGVELHLVTPTPGKAMWLAGPVPAKKLSPAEQFTKNDKNGDDSVTSEEAGEDYWESIAAFDADDNRAVDRSEHEAGLREKALARKQRFFTQMDRNKDGFVDVAEVPPALWDRWRSFDADSDNLLSEKEFLKAEAPDSNKGE